MTDNNNHHTRWASQRQEVYGDIVQAEAKNLSKEFRARLEQTLEALDKGLKHICSQDGEAIGVQGVKALTNAAEMLYKMHALEEGKPTDIMGKLQLTPANLMKRLKEIDPFGTYGEEESDNNGPAVN